jgi:electron-transferring-flavoprotein dehydrogenase
MNEYDVVIVGGATTGSYFARLIAQAGHSVLVIDRDAEGEVGNNYDIFHIAKHEFERFKLPYPKEGEDLSFELTGVDALSAYGKWPKPTESTQVGMHKSRYVARLNRWAQEAGAEYSYNASFCNFLFDSSEGGEIISGIEYEQDGETISVMAKLVADCSGIPSVARRSLPDGYGVENWEITPRDMFYVILRYVIYKDEKDYLRRARGWSFYKTWEARQNDPKGAILGVGASIGFETAEKMWNVFTDAVKLPEFELEKTERGFTPYRRPPYSFVADRFITMGDSACLTKPSNGEGVTSGMVQAEIAAEVIGRLLTQGIPLSTDALWPINKRYQEVQGEKFAGMQATLIGAVATNAKENDFFFKNDLIFSTKTFEAMDRDEALVFSTGEIIGMALKMLSGVIAGKLRISTIRALLGAMKNSGLVSELYKAYPGTPEGFEEWVKKADALWESVGSMADVVLL